MPWSHTPKKRGPIAGTSDPAFAAVAAAFEANFAERGEVGASVCVIHRGKVVVDLWGGWADTKTQRPWESDTVSIMFSATKGLAAMTVLSLVAAGLLDYDAPVARYWPEFGTAGKEDITVRMLMNHRAGLHGVETPLTLAQLAVPGGAAAACEAQAPAWAPGSDQGYHAVSYGLYAGELVRRVTGKRLGEVFAERVAGPLGLANDLWIGTPESAEGRVATLYPVDTKTKLTEIIPRYLRGNTHDGRVYRSAISRKAPGSKAFANPAELGVRGVHRYGTREIRAMDMPWCNAVGNARSLASAYAGLIGLGDKPRLIDASFVEPIYARQSWSEEDRVLLKPLGWSQGFLKEEGHLFSSDLQSFGHAGAGGFLGWVSPKHELAIGYVLNRMDFRVRSLRAIALAMAADAAVRALGPS